VARDHCRTVNCNIEAFTRDKSRTLRMNIETARDAFVTLGEQIGAEGDFERAVVERGTRHNAP
jgi:hypothetical protein